VDMVEAKGIDAGRRIWCSSARLSQPWLDQPDADQDY
jgi:hypothetical protein